MKKCLSLLILCIALLSSCSSPKSSGEQTNKTTEPTETISFFTPLLINNYESVSYELALHPQMPPIQSVSIASSNNGVASAKLNKIDQVSTITIMNDKGKVNYIRDKYAVYLYQPKVTVTFKKSDYDREKANIEQFFGSQMLKAEIFYINHYSGNISNKILQVQYEKNQSGFSIKNDSMLNIESDYAAVIENSRTALLDNSNIQNTVTNLVGNISAPKEKARAIFNYVRKQVQYDSVYLKEIDKQLISPTSTNGVLKTLSSQKGICQDQAYLMKVFMDKAGLKTRLVIGNFRGDPVATTHMWPEVNIDGQWIIADTAGNRFADDGNQGKYISVYYAEK